MLHHMLLQTMSFSCSFLIGLLQHSMVCARQPRKQSSKQASKQASARAVTLCNSKTISLNQCDIDVMLANNLYNI